MKKKLVLSGFLFIVSIWSLYQRIRNDVSILFILIQLSILIISQDYEKCLDVGPSVRSFINRISEERYESEEGELVAKNFLSRYVCSFKRLLIREKQFSFNTIFPKFWIDPCQRTTIHKIASMIDLCYPHYYILSYLNAFHVMFMYIMITKLMTEIE